MRSTLFHIPAEAWGQPVFGVGLLLALWAVGSILLLAWLAWRQGFNADTRGYVPVLLLVAAVIAWVLPAISDEYGLPIRGYGVMVVVAVIAGVGMAAYRARRMGVDPEMIMSLAVWLAASGFAGARLFYVAQYWDKMMAGKSVAEKLAAVVSINEGGLVVYGMLVVGGAALIAFIYRRKVPGLALADLIAPSVVLGLGLGRIGCFLNGCCFGGPCHLPWAVTFPADSGPHEQQIRLGQVYGLLVVADSKQRPIIGQVEPYTPAAAASLAIGAPIESINRHPVKTLAEAQLALIEAFQSGKALELTTPLGDHRLPAIPGTHERSRPVHPTQLYSAIDAFLLCAVLIAYYPFRRRDGEVTALTLTLHPISRFLLEIIRTDEGPVFGTPFSISQNISLIVLAGGIGLWLYLARQPRGTVWPARATASELT
jgi:phosphatidylglycerol---prolipoprotein diacylglyceryl transferase